MENILNKFLLSMSFYDKHENFYHGYMLGLFTNFLSSKHYIIKSNWEAGSGRFDIMIESVNRRHRVVIELKISDGISMESTARRALKQIKDKKYYGELVLDNVKDIKEIVIIFKGKKCIVR